MKFEKYIKLTEDEIFKAASPDEVKQRKAKYPEMRLKEIIDEILSRSTKNADGTIDIEGDVDLRITNSFIISDDSSLNLKELPNLNINKVNGSFNCSNNKLTSLKGCPKIINDDFECGGNQLTSLKGCPKEVNGDFICWNNKKEFTKEEVRQYCNVKGEIDV